jgi:glucose-1-phosphate thymidylyltransferase
MTSRCGLLLAGGSGSRLYPATLGTSKQMLPVYDKPMLFYSLSMLMLAGLRDIAIISTPRDLPAFQALLGDGTDLGMSLRYLEQPSPDGLAQAFVLGREFIAGRPSTLMLGDNVFHGAGLRGQLAEASARRHGATVFSYVVADPGRYGVVEVDDAGVALSIEEKPEHPRSHLAVTGLYFYDDRACDLAATLRPSARGELEITDLNRLYLADRTLHVQRLGRGIAWLDTGTPESLLEASTYVASVERRQGLRIGAIEEIAFRQGFIDAEQLLRLAARYRNNPYGQYLAQVIHEPQVSAGVSP